MQSRFTSTALALLIGAACAGANAQDKTRDQVRRELADAVRDGSLMRGEYDPASRPASAATMSTRTRAAVRAEFAAALRSGDLLAAGESSQKLNELAPARYPQPALLAGKTRAQVRAELAQAQRNGDLLAAGEAGLTQRELHPAAYPRDAMPVMASAPAGGAMVASARATR